MARKMKSKKGSPKTAVEKAEQELQRALRQPGHKAELKEYNSARRGQSAPATQVVADKKKKSQRRNALKRQLRKETW